MTFHIILTHKILTDHHHPSKFSWHLKEMKFSRPQITYSYNSHERKPQKILTKSFYSSALIHLHMNGKWWMLSLIARLYLLGGHFGPLKPFFDFIPFVAFISHLFNINSDSRVHIHHLTYNLQLATAYFREKKIQLFFL